MHLDGKSVKPGRKVSHVRAYGDDLDDVRARARHAAAWFQAALRDTARDKGRVVRGGGSVGRVLSGLDV